MLPFKVICPKCGNHFIADENTIFWNDLITAEDTITILCPKCEYKENL